MSQADQHERLFAVPEPPPASPSEVLLVMRDATERALLEAYLTSRGWLVRVADTSCAVRKWHAGTRAPFLVVKLEDDDPDAFELLGAQASRAISARTVVWIAPAIAHEITSAEAAILRIDRLLVGPSFTDVERSLAELRSGCADHAVA